MSDVDTEIKLIETIQDGLSHVMTSLDDLCVHLRNSSFSLKNKILAPEEISKVLNKTPEEVNLLNIKKHLVGGKHFYDLIEVLIFMKNTLEHAVGFEKEDAAV